MLRVLMVLEDYGELMFLQTVLKKMGFDVDATQNPRKLADSLLQMNPDLLVMTGFGKRVKGLELAKHVRRVRGIPKVILLKTGTVSEDQEAQVEGWLDSPVSAMSFLNLVADLCGLNREVLAEKFMKLQMRETPEDFDRSLRVTNPADEETMERSDEVGSDSATPFGNLQPSVLNPKDRQQRYSKFLTETPPKEHGFAAKAVAEQVRELRKIEDTSDNGELERQRRAFVEHLFKKKT